MRAIILLALFIAAVTAIPASPDRIVGGTATTISAYPTIAALLVAFSPTNFIHNCGGIILNNRSILTAAHCVHGDSANEWRVRVGSTNSNSGGVVHNFNRITMHPSFNRNTLDNDVAVLRASSTFSFNNNVRAASIAGSNYNLADNQVVWAAGWGATFASGWMSPVLRHVQIYTINQNTCVNRYRVRNTVITANMLCSGVLDVGGRDQCGGDSGGPLYHNGVVVGVCSFGYGCGHRDFPGVNARVSRYTSWIQNNA